jgi:hypothetical protein
LCEASIKSEPCMGSTARPRGSAVARSSVLTPTSFRRWHLRVLPCESVTLCAAPPATASLRARAQRPPFLSTCSSGWYCPVLVILSPAQALRYLSTLKACGVRSRWPWTDLAVACQDDGFLAVNLCPWRHAQKQFFSELLPHYLFHFLCG